MIHSIVINMFAPDTTDNVLWIEESQSEQGDFQYSYHIHPRDEDIWIEITEDSVLALQYDFIIPPIQDIVKNIHSLENGQYLDEKGYVITPVPLTEEETLDDETSYEVAR